MQRSGSRSVSAVFAGLALLVGMPRAIAAEDPFAGFPAVGAGELADQRGGMMIGGIAIDFAVVVRTAISDAANRHLALETTLLPSAGPVPAPAAQTTVAALGEATRVVQQVSPSQVQTLISNAADGVSVAQSTTINATLPTLRQVGQQFASHWRAAGLGADAALAGLRR
ncbi:MAG TPA: hypothetical protein HPQ04_15400 [Rhodospirillaceae bacterium]|nr:hypothetical protein [Rhodospirillaceae bacterium]